MSFMEYCTVAAQIKNLKSVLFMFSMFYQKTYLIFSKVLFLSVTHKHKFNGWDFCPGVTLFIEAFIFEFIETFIFESRNLSCVFFIII